MIRVSLLPVSFLSAGMALAQPSIEAYPPPDFPLDDYETAITLFGSGNRDVATCLFYRGQYRMRVFLDTIPQEDASGMSALFGAMNETVGRSINEWAGGDPEGWAASMDCALDWVRRKDDPLLPRAMFGASHDRVEAGFVELIDDVRSSADEIRAERARRGLENR